MNFAPSNEHIKANDDEQRNRSSTFHFDFNPRRYGMAAKCFGIMVEYYGFARNQSRRELVLSNLVIHEKMDFLVSSHWYGKYKQGAEERISSDEIIKVLNQRIPKHFVEAPESPRGILSLYLHHKEKVLIEGVQPFISRFLYLPEDEDTSFIYHSHKYPAHTVVFASSLGSVSMKMDFLDGTNIR